MCFWTNWIKLVFWHKWSINVKVYGTLMYDNTFAQFEWGEEVEEQQVVVWTHDLGEHFRTSWPSTETSANGKLVMKNWPSVQFIMELEPTNTLCCVDFTNGVWLEVSTVWNPSVQENRFLQVDCSPSAKNILFKFRQINFLLSFFGLVTAHRVRIEKLLSLAIPSLWARY